MAAKYKVFHKFANGKRHWSEGPLHETRSSTIEKRIDDLKNELIGRLLVHPF